MVNDISENKAVNMAFETDIRTFRKIFKLVKLRCNYLLEYQYLAKLTCSKLFMICITYSCYSILDRVKELLNITDHSLSFIIPKH